MSDVASLVPNAQGTSETYTVFLFDAYVLDATTGERMKGPSRKRVIATGMSLEEAVAMQEAYRQNLEPGPMHTQVRYRQEMVRDEFGQALWAAADNAWVEYVDGGETGHDGRRLISYADWALMNDAGELTAEDRHNIVTYNTRFPEHLAETYCQLQRLAGRHCQNGQLMQRAGRSSPATRPSEASCPRPTQHVSSLQSRSGSTIGLSLRQTARLPPYFPPHYGFLRLASRLRARLSSASFMLRWQPQ